MPTAATGRRQARHCGGSARSIRRRAERRAADAIRAASRRLARGSREWRRLCLSIAAELTAGSLGRTIAAGFDGAPRTHPITGAMSGPPLIFDHALADTRRRRALAQAVAGADFLFAPSPTT